MTERLDPKREKEIRKEAKTAHEPEAVEFYGVKELLDELDAVRIERNTALDALTVTQEEWLLRVQSLERERDKLKIQVEKSYEAMQELAKGYDPELAEWGKEDD